MYFVDVQATVADQFPAEQQYGNLVSVACTSEGIRVDIDHIEWMCTRLRQRGELGLELLTQQAARARVEQEAHVGESY